MALFCTGLVDSASRASSTSMIGIMIFAFPSLSGDEAPPPLTDMVFTFPAPPNSFHSEIVFHVALSVAVPVNWKLSHLLSLTAYVNTIPLPSLLTPLPSAAAMAVASV